MKLKSEGMDFQTGVIRDTGFALCFLKGFHFFTTIYFSFLSGGTAVEVFSTPELVQRWLL